FFCQAEDGIRDRNVTGVQTCALPILGQREYLAAIRKNAVTFGVGPAGTGKTYLAVAMAVKAFKSKDVSRIVLTRPAVEAGEKLEIGRASCRERAESAVGAGSSEKRQG